MNVIDTKLEHDPNFMHNIYYENWASKFRDTKYFLFADTKT